MPTAAAAVKFNDARDITKCWADQLRKRKQGFRWYARDQRPNEDLVGLVIS